MSEYRDQYKTELWSNYWNCGPVTCQLWLTQYGTAENHSALHRFLLEYQTIVISVCGRHIRGSSYYHEVCRECCEGGVYYEGDEDHQDGEAGDGQEGEGEGGVKLESWSFCNDMVVYLCFVSLADTTKK